MTDNPISNALADAYDAMITIMGPSAADDIDVHVHRNGKRSEWMITVPTPVTQGMLEEVSTIFGVGDMTIEPDVLFPMHHGSDGNGHPVYTSKLILRMDCQM